VKKEVNFFMENSDNNILQYLSSNERLVLWTYYLRQHINKLFSKPIPKLEDLIIDTKQINKVVWGNIVWIGLHNVVLKAQTVGSYCPIEVSQALKAFITCIAILIPCPYCRKHAWEYYSEHSIDEWLDTPLHAFEWTVIFHNEVTSRTNIEHKMDRPTYTLEKALQLYKK
jgi:hypothetical protein